MSYIRAKKFTLDEKKIGEYPKISILILTFNALPYVQKTLESLAKFRPQNSEIIVWDNASNNETKEYLKKALDEKLIDKLSLSEVNHFFIKGNNEAAKLSSYDSEYLLFLNSDIELNDKDWINILLKIQPQRGISALGVTDIPIVRPDGWCMMVDKKTFQELGGLNEYYKMNWGITEFTGKVLQKGYSVSAVINPEKYITHFGQKSYIPSTTQQKFNKMSNQDAVNLFKGKQISFFKI